MMTREQAIELLKNRKVYVNGRSAEIQKKLFELGFKWITGDEKIKIEDAPFLYIPKLQEHGFSHGNDMLQFTRDSSQEISAEEILAIEVEQDFKENDVVVSGFEIMSERRCEWVAVYNKKDYGNYYAKVVLFLVNDAPDLSDIEYDSFCNAQQWTRPATEDEKGKLIDALKNSPDKRAKQILEEVFGIVIVTECPFKPYDRVLVRDNNDDDWSVALFSHIRDDEGRPYVANCFGWSQCIAYEGHESLVGTTNNPED